MTSYSKNFPLVAVFIFIGLFTSSIPTRAETTIQSITLEAGPVATKHIQAGNEDYRERHGLGILKVHTNDYGNWALYLLAPNSVDNTSVGVGYVTDPYTLPVGPLKLELSGALGLVTGYQDYPVPLWLRRRGLSCLKMVRGTQGWLWRPILITCRKRDHPGITISASLLPHLF